MHKREKREEKKDGRHDHKVVIRRSRTALSVRVSSNRSNMTVDSDGQSCPAWE